MYILYIICFSLIFVCLIYAFYIRHKLLIILISTYIFLIIIALICAKYYYKSEDIIESEKIEYIGQTNITMHDKVLGSYKFKKGTNVDNLVIEMDSAAMKINNCYRKILDDEDFKPIITSGNDSPVHNQNSYHYKNKALDFRIRDLKWINRAKILQCINDSLDYRFYIKHESIGTTNEHLHVHFKN